MFKSGECAGQRRCRSSASCSSNHDWTVPAVWKAAFLSWRTADHGKHLITLPVHVLHCSNPGMKSNNGTNRILYHDIAAQIITEPTSVSLLEPGIPDCRLPWVFSKRNYCWCGEKHWRTTHLTVSRPRFQLPDDPVLWSWHHRLRIWALLSVIRGLAIAALPWMLDLWSSRRTVFVETGSSRWIFSSAAVHLCCGTCDFSKQSSSMYDDLFLSMLTFTHCSFSLMLSFYDSCMPT
jgi:hypothetical protein